jgi:GT2 family glycosyltransferase
MNQRVTIIVPTYKREQLLVDTLRCVASVEYPLELLEVIVVDQTEHHEAEVQRYLEEQEKEGKIRWFKPPEIDFASLTKARNFGIHHATKADIIVFIDDDVEFKPDFVHQHVMAYDDPQVMAVGGRITVPGHVYPSGEPAEISRVTWWGAFVNNFYGTHPSLSGGFVGCNFSVRVSILAESGIMDENFIGNAMREETDLAVRIRSVGGVIRFIPEAYVIHHMAVGGGTRSEGRRDWYFAFFHNHFLFYRKHAPGWRIPFFVLHLWRPILACSFVYGKGRLSWLGTPWAGIHSGIKAAKRSRQSGVAMPKVVRQTVL